VASLNPLALVGLGGRLWLPETAGRGPAHPRWPPIHQNRNSRPATRPSAEAVDRNRRAERRSYEQVTVFFTTHYMEVHLADPAAHGISQSSTKLRPTAVSRVALAASRDTDQVWSPSTAAPAQAWKAAALEAVKPLVESICRSLTPGHTQPASSGRHVRRGIRQSRTRAGARAAVFYVRCSSKAVSSLGMSSITSCPHASSSCHQRRSPALA
jgi:hypothetical protein